MMKHFYQLPFAFKSLILLGGLFCISLLAQVNAQDCVFQVVDSETHKDLKGVVVHSRIELNGEEPNKTDFLGRVNLHVAEKDTISFVLEGYYPVHILIHEHENYDFLHPFHVYLTSISHDDHQFDHTHFHEMEAYDFHFDQDHSEEIRALKMKVLEPTQALSKRERWMATTRDRYEQGFNVIVIKAPSKKE